MRRKFTPLSLLFQNLVDPWDYFLGSPLSWFGMEYSHVFMHFGNILNGANESNYYKRYILSKLMFHPCIACWSILPPSTYCYFNSKSFFKKYLGIVPFYHEFLHLYTEKMMTNFIIKCLKKCIIPPNFLQMNMNILSKFWN